MSEWNRVKYIKNVKFTVDSCQAYPAIYGNKRNCAKVTLSFNGMNDQLEDPVIDLSDVNIALYTYLIDFYTNKNLPWIRIPSQFTEGLFYSYTSSKFCNSPPSSTHSRSPAPLDIASQRQACITYYVYGRCQKDITILISANVRLADGKILTIAKEDERLHKVEIVLVRPVRYLARDLQPIKWTKVLEIKHQGCISFSHEVAYVKLRREFRYSWLDCKFENVSTSEGDLVFVAQTTETYGNLFYLCRLGNQSTWNYRLQSPIEGKFEIDLEYNQEASALCIIKITGFSINPLERITDIDKVIFKLYDEYGNMGSFKLNFENPNLPTIDNEDH